MEAVALMARLEELVRTTPDFGGYNVYADQDAIVRWTARLDSILGIIGDRASLIELRVAIDGLNGITHSTNQRRILSILHRTIAATELRLPADAKGAFIPVGHDFDALTAISKIIGEATKTLMFVDPYMSEKSLTTYCIMANLNVSVQLLVSSAKVKPGLMPAAQEWQNQYGADRPLAVRGVRGALLHDRMIIIDDNSAWNCTQSFDAIAARSPASITKSAPKIACDQIAAFNEMFGEADLLFGSMSSPA